MTNRVSEGSLSRRGGDTNGGFEAKIDKRTRLLRVRLWGVWDVPIAEAFVNAVSELGTELGSAPWSSLVDARKFMVQGPQILQLRQESLNRAAMLGCTRMATLVESAVYGLQFKRLSGASHIESDLFHDEISALTWLRRL